jgi:hypothetical protein
MKRTDPHSPSNLRTEDYEFAYCYDAHPAEGDRAQAMIWLNLLLEDGWRFGQVHGGDTCDHCGARLRYVAVLKHIPSHTLIKVGEQCLDNRFSLATSEFHRLRRSAKLNRERKVMAEVRAEFARDNADVIAFLAEKMTECEARFGYIPEPEYDYHLNLRFWEFYISLYTRLERKGTLSDAQVAAVRKSIVKDRERAARREDELADAEPVPSGKGTITGEIVKIDLQVNDYGSREVMTVKDDRGFKVWGTQPRSLYEAKVGDRVTFTATLERSDRDEFFGFFKRPSKAKTL